VPVGNHGSVPREPGKDKGEIWAIR
jgi:hypothetical protein